VPVLGIGGIGLANARAIRAAGATGVAVIGAVWEPSDPEAAARALRSGGA
jgi:thiamine-phosphate pyrophosphorylase